MMRKQKVASLIAIVGIGLVSGVFDLALFRSSLLPLAELAEMIAFALFALLWVNADAAERSIETSRGLRAAVVLLAAIAVPIYLLQSRGVRGVIAIFGAAAVMGAMCVAYYAGWYGAYGLLYRR